MVTLEELVGMITVPMMNIIKAGVAKELSDSRALLEKIFDTDFNTFEEFLKEKDYVRSEDKEDLTADDVPDDLKEDIAYDWIEYNPNEACEKALDDMSSSDMAEVAKDIIDRL